MASPISANRAELLAIANSVASEKLIDRAIVIEAMEDAIQRAARARYGAENDIRAKLDPNSGDLRLWRVVEVVEQVDDYFKQVDLAAGQKLQKDAKVGDFIVDQNGISPSDAVINLNLREQTAQVLKTLTPREEKIIKMRFGLQDGSEHTLEEVGQHFAVTRERIRQIEAKALRKLRHPSRSHRLRAFLDTSVHE